MLSIWSVDSDSRVGDEFNPDDEIVVPALSPDGTRLAIARANGAFEVIDLASRQPVGDALVGHRNAIFSVAFSPDGRLIASSDLDGHIFLWDAATGVRIAGPLDGHTQGVDDVAFSQSGDRLFSVGQDDLLLSWSLAPDDLARVACGVANRNLTIEEWARIPRDDAVPRDLPRTRGIVGLGPRANVSVTGGPAGSVFGSTVPERRIEPVFGDQSTACN